VAPLENAQSSRSFASASNSETDYAIRRLLRSIYAVFEDSEQEDPAARLHLLRRRNGGIQMGGRLMVAAVLLILTVACSGGDNNTPTTPSSGLPGPSISIVAGASGLTTTAYSPNPQTISRGTTITFVNNDSTSHTATSGGAFDTGVISAGGRASVTLQNTGSFTYKCTLHPNMTGTLVVQ
jgi:plastocyanin